MSYTVIVLKDAEREIEEAYQWLLKQTRQYAPLWYNGIIDAILSLEELAGRCPRAPENAETPHEEIRQLLYGKRPHLYRILFSIRDDKVMILHVRHAARMPRR
jgi:plasmid stabilization system protein ParE